MTSGSPHPRPRSRKRLTTRSSAYGRGRLGWFGVLVAALICTSPRGAPPSAAPLLLEPSGCHAVLADGACERPVQGRIRVWVDASPPFVIRLDDREASSEIASVTPLTEGSRITIDVGNASRLDVEAEGRRKALRLLPPFAPSWAVEASAARARGDHALARSLASPAIDVADPSARARALGIVGRAELSLGNVSEAMPLLGRASAEASAAGRISDAVDDALALSFALSQRAGRWREARLAIDRLQDLLAAYPDGRARVPYYRALASAALGDLRNAMRDLRVARAQAERLGLERLVWNTRNGWALVLERSGRRAEALAELIDLASTRDQAEIVACDRATTAFNIGFGSMMLARERKSPCSIATPPPDAARWLREALDPRATRCPDPAYVAMGHVLLGDLALEAGDVDGAARELASVSLRDAGLALRRDALDLDARIALARADPRGALAKFERLVAIAQANGRADDQRQALEGAGQALEKLGMWETALARYEAADELVAASSVLVPLGEAGAYRGARDLAARARVELLVRHGRVREALTVARRARVDLLASLTSIDRIAEMPEGARARWFAAIDRYKAERAALDEAGGRDWELAATELARAQNARAESLHRLRAALDDAMSVLPGPDADLPHLARDAELGLFVMTLREGAVVFVDDTKTTRATRIDSSRTQTLGALEAAIFSAASPDLERAASVRIVASSDLACVDLHAHIRTDGRSLARAARVTYGLDLPGQAGPRRPSKLALIVSDAHGDLPLARDEGALMASQLGTRFDVLHLGGAKASAPAVRDALADATLFHYAGHAHEAEGDVFLPLAGRTMLTTSDILSLPSAPERVALSACQAGRVQAHGLPIALGLVQAFVERGATEVLAPTRPVRDELALSLARAFSTSKSYEFSAAISALAASQPDSDWAAYRVWGR